MNYQKLHDAIIAHARLNPPTTNVERHHIIPRSIGGTDDPSNLVDVTYRHHFILHWLLTKLTPHEGKLCYAFHMMSHQSSSRSRPDDEVMRRVNSRAYANNKARLSEILSERMKGVPKTEDQKAKMRVSAVERWQRPGQKEAQAKRMEGNTLGSFTRFTRLNQPTEEQRKKQSESIKEWFKHNNHPMKGKKSSPEAIAKMKETKRLNPRVWTDEERKAFSEKRTGFKQPDSQKKKVAEANSDTWEVTLPSGEKLILKNLRQFCLKHNLAQGNFVTYGHTKGYRAVKVSND